MKMIPTLRQAKTSHFDGNMPAGFRTLLLKISRKLAWLVGKSSLHLFWYRGQSLIEIRVAPNGRLFRRATRHKVGDVQ
jgi:hypothetical protein